MDERDIIMLEALIQTQNLTHAAERLFTTQPALTKRLRRLEAELNCRLFIRSKKGMMATSAAESILPSLRVMLDELKRIREIAACSSDEVSGVLRIGAAGNYAHYRLPDVLKKYIALYPRVDVSVVSDLSRTLYRQLCDDEISLAVVRGDYSWDGVDQVLSREAVCFATGRGNEGRPLKDLPCILRRSDTELSGQIDRWRFEQGLNDQWDSPRLSVSDTSTCLALLKKGIGWSLLPSIALEDFDGVVRPLYFADGTPVTRATHILYRKSACRLPQVRAFVELALEHEASLAQAPGR